MSYYTFVLSSRPLPVNTWTTWTLSGRWWRAPRRSRPWLTAWPNLRVPFCRWEKASHVKRRPMDVHLTLNQADFVRAQLVAVSIWAHVTSNLFSPQRLRSHHFLRGDKNQKSLEPPKYRWFTKSFNASLGRIYYLRQSTSKSKTNKTATELNAQNRDKNQFVRVMSTFDSFHLFYDIQK